MRFFYKITALFIALIVFWAAIQVTVFDKYFVTETDSTLLNINQQAAKNLSDQISAYFAKIQNALEIVAQDQRLQENQDLLDVVNKFIPEIDILAILNRQGDIEKISGLTHRPILTNLAHKDYYLQAMQGKSYITDVFTSASGKKEIAIAVPIKKSGKVDGVVVAFIDLRGTALASLFDNKSFGENGYISIIDGQGRIVYHRDGEMIGQNSNYFSKLTQSQGASKEKDFTEQEQYVGYNKISGLNWLVTVNTPTSEIKNAKKIVIYEITIISILGVILIALLGIYSVKRSLQPFEKLMQAFKRLKTGKYEQIKSDCLPQELHEMADIYNSSVKILKTNYENLEEAAETDLLTGAYNRRAFDSVFSQLERNIQQGSLATFSIAVVDLDNFKIINDTYGHVAGDKILKTFIEIVYNVLERENVFRFGGDEFLLLLPEKDQTELESMGEKIRSDSERLLNGCTVSIGIANFPSDCASVERLFELADEALYISKNNRNKVTFYKDIIEQTI